MHVRAHSWIFAAPFLLAFSWLGCAALRCRPICEAFPENLPETTKLFSTYGPVACPILGIIAAITLILSDVLLPKRWAKAALILTLVTLLISIVRACLFVPLSMGQLRAKVPLEALLQGQQFDEVRPAQLSRQRGDNWLLWEGLRQRDHSRQIAGAESLAELGNQFCRQCRQNLLPIFGPFLFQDVLADSVGKFLGC
jgi:hypothetical protein